jgi:hypothetical protein
MRAGPPALLLALVLASGSAATPALAAGGSVSGTVTDPEGQPLAGICIDVVSLGGETAGELESSATDASGRFEVGGLAAGDYAVGVNTCPDPDLAFAGEWFDDQGGFESATPVAVTATGAVALPDTLLARTGSIAGTVTDDDDGRALGGICVRGFSEQGSGFGEDVTDEAGAYVLQGLPAGDYVVVLTDCAAPFTHRDELYDDIPIGPDTTQEPTSVTVRAGERTSGVDAALAEGGALQGTVTAAHTGRPQSLVCIGLYPGSSSTATEGAVSGFGPDSDEPFEDGRFVAGGIEPGTYAVAYNADVCGDDGYDVTWYDGAATRAGATPVTVAKGETVTEVDGLVTPRASTSFVCSTFDQDQSTAFPDVSRDNVHRSSVTCMGEAGIVRGRPDGSFGPGEPVRRGQLASFVARLLETTGVELPATPPNAFDDDAGSPHERSIDQLAELGVLGGKGPRRFAPEETVARGQLATVLVGAYEQATGFTLLRPPNRRFPDTAGTTHEANIDRAALAGLAVGTSATTFDAGGQVRRDAVATFLARTLDRVSRDTLSAGFVSGDGAQPAPSGEAAPPPPGVQRLRALVAPR